MLLVIDAGNTETVFGVFEGETLRAHWRLSSKSPKTKDECAVLFEAWCASSGIQEVSIQGVVIASVVPAWNAVFEGLARDHLGIQPLMVEADLDTGLQILYETPAQVGADRICNAVAGIVRYGCPLVVVDFGTAITLDVIGPEREYWGGAIALGLDGAAQELHRLAAKLPRVALQFPPSVVGRNTETSIQSGLLWGTVSLVEGLIDRILQEMGWERVRVIATGGLASLIAPYSHRIEVVDPFLTLEGMRLIYERNPQPGRLT